MRRQLCGMPAVIVMPSDAPRPKRERTAAFGAEVVLYDRDTRGSRGDRARRSREKRGATLVPPFDDPMIIAGQGTAGREIAEDLAALGLKPDVAVIGASGGGLRRASRWRSRRACRRRDSTRPSRRASTTPRARSRAASASAMRA